MFDAAFLTAQVQRLLDAHLRELAHLVRFELPSVPDDALAAHVALLCDAANGTLGDCRDDATDDAVSAAWDKLYLALTSSAAAFDAPDDAFWSSPPGRLLLAARLWLDCDALMTLTDAALLARGCADRKAVKWVSDQIAAGRLDAYTDPDEPNPRRSRRVRRSQVEALTAHP